MSPPNIFVLTLAAMIAFAGNSILCRLALKSTSIDAATFTSVRLIAGALVLFLIVRLGPSRDAGKGTPASALALFLYAACFSFAYLSLSTGMGALILFGAVQVTMIGYGLRSGERLDKAQFAGLFLALAGLVALLSPGLQAPPLFQSLLMGVSGIAWGVYSLRAKNTGDPTRVTAENFLLAIPLTLLLSAITIKSASLDVAGIGYAVASGALASGIGYAIWYKVLPSLRATNAATIQLCVPVLATIGGVMFLGESVNLRLVLSSIAILGGVALVVLGKRQS